MDISGICTYSLSITRTFTPSKATMLTVRISSLEEELELYLAQIQLKSRSSGEEE
jgi:hypothetical protein